MESISEKQFSSQLPVVEAIPFPKDNRTKLLAGGILGGFLGYIVIALWLYKSYSTGFFYYFTAIASVIAVFMIANGLKKTFVSIKRRRQLESKGRKTQATIIGRESNLEADPEMFWIYYQFQPDFVVKHHDETNDQYFFHLPIGHPIEVLYLSENLRITGVATLKKK